ncbi:MAG: serine/threonine-protein phosphatase [Clostridia bacterium]|nr:serine/threonine-protein phosphatase [Clostridia bacterium]
MKYCTYTDVGSRANNEDYLTVASVGNRHLLIVNDGVGGAQAGELAAQAAADEMKALFLASDLSFDLKTAVLAANDRVFRLQHETGKDMKTTVTAVYITEKEVQCAHVGDSRIYLFTQENILYRSLDHSAAQAAVFAGEIDESGIRTYPSRNVLSRALGVYRELPVSVETFPFSAVRGMLLCTDGFWEYVYEDEMLSLFRFADDPQQWLGSMQSLLKARVGIRHDNNTAIAVMVVI